jgi:hypothetical protein
MTKERETSELDEIGKEFKNLMWVYMEDIYNEDHNGKVRTSPHSTTQARVLEHLKGKLLYYWSKN